MPEPMSRAIPEIGRGTCRARAFHASGDLSNLDRIVRSNIAEQDLTHARHNFRVSITRAKLKTTIDAYRKFREQRRV